MFARSDCSWYEVKEEAEEEDVNDSVAESMLVYDSFL
jgi:hypothetical protein